MRADSAAQETPDSIQNSLSLYYDSFRWHGAKQFGPTAIGRTTIQVLDMNHPAYVLVRQALMDAGLFG